MIDIHIPGYKDLRLEHLVMDVNGTLALDGTLITGVQPRLQRLGQKVHLHMLTADTHGKQSEIDKILGFDAHIIRLGSIEKAVFVRELDSENVVAIGNGANDVGMCEMAVFSIAVLGQAGVARHLLEVADVIVRDINDGLDLLMNPERLHATLRR